MIVFSIMLIFLSTLSLRRATWYSIAGGVHNAKFLSTLSLRRATVAAHVGRRKLKISIHALLAESDPSTTRRLTNIIISIHALLAESDCNTHTSTSFIQIFLSTLSLRRATVGTSQVFQRIAISIHALLAESDSKSAQNSGALLRIWNKFYGDCIFMLTGKAVFYPFCPCFFHIFWCEGSGNFMIAFPSH